MDHRTERLRRRADEYLRAGQASAAVAALESLLQRAPEDDASRLDLALARLRLDQYCAAHALVLEACERDPGNPALALPRLEALRAFSEHGRMLALARAVTDLDVLPATTLTQAASVLESAGVGEQARRWIGAAMVHHPIAPQTRVNRAMIALDHGDIDTAESDLESLANHSPMIPMAHWLLAGLRRQDEHTHHIDRLRQRLAQPGLDPHSVAWLAFALHKELDDVGRHDEAWAALETGLAAKRSTLRWDERGRDALVDALMAAFAGVQPPAASATQQTAVTPVFIVGMHRSGTSLLERILEAHPQLAAGGESMRLTAELRHATHHHSSDVIDPTMIARLDQVDFERLGQRWLDASRWISDGHTHFTEKLPLNWMLLGLIRRALPQAKVLNLVRDPMDTGWSNLRELFAGNTAPWSYDLRTQAREYARYRRVMDHWHRVLPGFVLDVDYAGLVSDPERSARRVYAFCGLSWVEACIAVERTQGPVRSASAVQVRAPIHTRSRRRWSPYSAQLEPMREELIRLGMQT